MWACCHLLSKLALLICQIKSELSHINQTINDPSQKTSFSHKNYSHYVSLLLSFPGNRFWTNLQKIKPPPFLAPRAIGVKQHTARAVAWYNFQAIALGLIPQDATIRQLIQLDKIRLHFDFGVFRLVLAGNQNPFFKLLQKFIKTHGCPTYLRLSGNTLKPCRLTVQPWPARLLARMAVTPPGVATCRAPA